MWNVATFCPTWILKDVSIEVAVGFLIHDSVFGFNEIFDFGDDFDGISCLRIKVCKQLNPFYV